MIDWTHAYAAGAGFTFGLMLRNLFRLPELGHWAIVGLAVVAAVFWPLTLVAMAVGFAVIGGPS